MKDKSCISVQTSVGEVRVIWTPGERASQVFRVLLSGTVDGENIHPEPFPPAGGVGITDNINLLCLNIQQVLNGKNVEFSLEDVDLNVCAVFQRKVLFQTWKIPRGKVMSYGYLSETIGISGGARAVGTALAKNPFPLIIPCHRVIRENGHLGGFGGGLTLKRTLLEMEGIAFDPGGRVLRECFYTSQCNTP